MKNKLKKLEKIFWIFIIGCILGYIFEMTIVLFQKGHFESRQGLIYGPFSPVYGIGGIIYYVIFKNIKTRNKLAVFFIAMVLGGTTEYICSFVQEKIFGTISWDYSYLPFNLNGRTSLLHCTYWGIAGILYTTCIEPLIEGIERILDKKRMETITIVFVLFMILNIQISSIASIRQKDRMNNIPPQNKLDVFLDEHYPDEFMDKVYANKKNVK